MAMAHQPLVAVFGVLVGMAAEEGCDLGLDSLRQQGSGALTQNFGQRIGEGFWLNQLGNIILGHGVSLLRWRSGGSNPPTIRRLNPSRRHQLPRIPLSQPWSPCLDEKHCHEHPASLAGGGQRAETVRATGCMIRSFIRCRFRDEQPSLGTGSSSFVPSRQDCPYTIWGMTAFDPLLRPFLNRQAHDDVCSAARSDGGRDDEPRADRQSLPGCTSLADPV